MTLRKKEDWMTNGARVIKSGITGTLTQVITCKTDGPVKKYVEGEEFVMKMYVRNDGVLQAWPVNPNDVDRLEDLKMVG